MSVACDSEDLFSHSYSVATTRPLGTLPHISALQDPRARASTAWNITSDQCGGHLQRSEANSPLALKGSALR